MWNFKTFFIVLIIVLTNWSLIGQEIYIASASSEGIKKFIDKNKLQKVRFIYQNSFVTKDELDEDKLVQIIAKVFPDKDQYGIAVLDWEGKTFGKLLEQSQEGEYAREQFTTAIKKAKQLRPNVKWSFYGLPTRNFWKPDSNWKKENYELELLLSNFDFLSPSIYIFYDSDEVNISLQNRYIDTNIQLAKEIGEKIKKPVYPVINHRFHPSNKKKSHQLVPNQLFAYYVNRIFENNVKSVIWWHSEDYNYNISNKNKVFSNDYPESRDKNIIQEKMFEEYYKNISKIIK